MFSFFKKKNLVTDVSWLGVDIHSHILPGIDDGSKTIEQSLSYVEMMHNLGYQKLICTPHIFTELYPNTPETILPLLKVVQQSVLNNGIDISVEAAAEYMINNDFKVASDLLTLPGNYLLIEMSYLSEAPNIENIIFELQVKGYKLVLAHPERYNFYHKEPHRYKRLREMGCLFQLNLLSITGYYGSNVKNAAQFLILEKMYDLAGSDLHHDKHMALLRDVVQSGRLYNAIGTYPFRNKEIFI
jgi:protein-tyrosine phosphatase